MNIWDVVILIVVAGALFLAIRRVRKNKGGCGCGCSGCPQRGKCGRAA